MEKKEPMAKKDVVKVLKSAKSVLEHKADGFVYTFAMARKHKKDEKSTPGYGVVFSHGVDRDTIADNILAQLFPNALFRTIYLMKAAQGIKDEVGLGDEKKK